MPDDVPIDEEPSPDDDELNLDLATIVRSQALTALGIVPEQMTRVDQLAGLPPAATLEGTRWAKRVFTNAASPRAAETHRLIAYAGVMNTGLDCVRFEYDVTAKPFVVLEARTFFLIILPSSVERTPFLSSVLQLEKPLAWSEPDGEGWSSTNPDKPLQSCSDWKERIDSRKTGDRWAILAFKIEVRTRQFSPSPVWFSR